MGDLVRVILVYKSGLVFFLTEKTKKIENHTTSPKAVLNMCKFLTLVQDELEGHILHKNGVEFYQESNGHGPRHVTCVCYVSTHVDA